MVQGVYQCCKNRSFYRYSGAFVSFFIKESSTFPRLQMVYFIGLYFALSYLTRQLVKKIIAVNYQKSRSYKQIMLISSSDKVEKILEKFKESNNWYFKIAYIVLADRDAEGEEIGGIPVIANLDDMFEVSRNKALDGVFINIGDVVYKKHDMVGWLHGFQNMGVTVHVNIDALELDVSNKKVEKLGFFKVVSYSSKIYDPAQLVIKRIMDIVGGFIGSIITVIFGIFLVPAICIESPGEPIYSSIRVGRNGRHFKMYKLRMLKSARQN